MNPSLSLTARTHASVGSPASPLTPLPWKVTWTAPCTTASWGAEDTDVTITTVDGHRLEVHRAVVLPHVEAWAAALETESTLTPTVHDPLRLVGVVLESMYTGTLVVAALDTLVGAWTVAAELGIWGLEAPLQARLRHLCQRGGDDVLMALVTTMVRHAFPAAGCLVVRTALDVMARQPVPGFGFPRPGWLPAWQQVPFAWLDQVLCDEAWVPLDETTVVRCCVPAPGRLGGSWTLRQRTTILTHFRWAHVDPAMTLYCHQDLKVISADTVVTALVVRAHMLGMPQRANWVGPLQGLRTKPSVVFQTVCRPATVVARGHRPLRRVAFSWWAAHHEGRLTMKLRLPPPQAGETNLLDRARLTCRIRVPQHDLGMWTPYLHEVTWLPAAGGDTEAAPVPGSGSDPGLHWAVVSGPTQEGHPSSSSSSSSSSSAGAAWVTTIDVERSCLDAPDAWPGLRLVWNVQGIIMPHAVLALTVDFMGEPTAPALIRDLWADWGADVQNVLHTTWQASQTGAARPH